MSISRKAAKTHKIYIYAKTAKYLLAEWQKIRTVLESFRGLRFFNNSWAGGFNPCIGLLHSFREAQHIAEYFTTKYTNPRKLSGLHSVPQSFLSKKLELKSQQFFSNFSDIWHLISSERRDWHLISSERRDWQLKISPIPHKHEIKFPKKWT